MYVCNEKAYFLYSRDFDDLYIIGAVCMYVCNEKAYFLYSRDFDDVSCQTASRAPFPR